MHMCTRVKDRVKGILVYLVSGPKSTPDFPGIPWTSPDFY
jgi:hypothetical protein